MNAKVFLALLLVMAFPGNTNAEQHRNIVNINADWSFYLGDAVDAQKPEFNDASWRKLNVPHDWSIEGEYNQANPTGRGGGFLPAGIGWYRKQLVIPTSESRKCLMIHFDGVMANSDVWINGQYLGKQPYGYVPFSYEITGKVTFGDAKPNVIAVRVDNSQQPASRWYAGAGIYRQVRLVCLNPVHLDKWGVFITTPKVSAENATVSLQITVSNQSKKSEKVIVQTTITAPNWGIVQSSETTLSIESGAKKECKQEVVVPNPRLWDIASPNLYQAVTTIRQGKEILDVQKHPFGIREFRFEAATGFYLNGRNLKILGVCLHQDGGPLGVAVPSSVWKRRLQMLRKCGVNAIRTAHNPMDPAFYDWCDRLGFLVMDESFDTWTVAKPNATFGYNLFFNQWWESDTREMVLRDRNHPSIILYSVGNEIRDRLDKEDGRQRFLNQRDLVHQLDPTRPVTMALFRPNEMQVYTNGFADLSDVLGQNYREQELIAAWKDKPERKVIGSENGHDNKTWLVLRDNPFMAGQFLWTGIDYLGEANWPAISWDRALLDRNGYLKPVGWERQSWWSKIPMVKIVRSEDNAGKGPLVSDWTPADFGTYDEAYIYAYSNCDEVELFLNGASKGRQTIHADASPRFWNIGFNAGSLRAVAYNKGRAVAVDEWRTADAPVKILLTAERQTIHNDWNDLVYVKATLVDKNGLRNPNINTKLTFSVTGPGILKAVDNGDILSHEKYVGTVRTTYQGEAVALIQASADSGTITVSVGADGLEGSRITLKAISAE